MLTSKKTWIFLGIILGLSLMAKQPITHAVGFENQTIFADPFSIDSATYPVGSIVTVKINITDAEDLWSANVGLKFNPDVLECTGVALGEFWTRQGGSPLWIPGTIDNSKGEVTYCGMSFTTPATPQDGSGTLMTATFRVKATGFSDIHLLNVKTNTRVDSNILVTTSRIQDKYTLEVDTGKYIVTILHNATGTPTSPASGIPNMVLNQVGKYIAYNMTFKSYMAGVTMLVYCNVTIPKTFMWGPTWTVRVDGSDVTATIDEDVSNTYIYFTTSYTTTTATRKIEIQGTDVVPELYPLMTLPLILAALSLAILTAVGNCGKARPSGNVKT